MFWSQGTGCRQNKALCLEGPFDTKVKTARGKLQAPLGGLNQSYGLEVTGDRMKSKQQFFLEIPSSSNTPVPTSHWTRGAQGFTLEKKG